MSSEGDDGTSESPLAASEGERRAMIGYVPQYELGAMVILRHLRNQTFEFVRLSDPTAGQVDDFVVGSLGSIDGYSVKWSQYRSNITFNDFVKNRKNVSPWIKQLADGWKALKAEHPNRKATVHLVSSDIPSSSDLCVGATGKLKSFAAFMHQAFLPRQERGESVPPEWQGSWEALQKASGLDAPTFAEFVNDCRLDLAITLPTDRAPSSRDETVYIRQIWELARVLPDIVRDPSRRVEYDRASLLKRLGWTELFEFRHRHEFPVRDLYEPISATVNLLKAKLKSLPGGYIGLFGSPGSGKSTLLTRTLEEGLGKHRLIKYYAFVPGTSDPRSQRGESVNFLHDLVVSLERAGFSTGQSQGIFDQHLLQERLHASLKLLGDSYAKTKFPTVILIDGLDHIPREQSPERSLLVDLPAPDQIPQGVFIVLGSQTDNLPGLSPAVRRAVQDPTRRVEMESLSRPAALKLVGAANLKVPLADPQREKVLSLASGYPLALSFLLNRLGACTTAEEVEAVLNDSLSFKGSIEEYYFAHWEQIASEPGLADLVGLLARLRREIDLQWVSTWADPSAVAALRRKMAHFFREERAGYWRFFHNSFRHYALVASAKLTALSPDAAEAHSHKKLAAICEKSAIPHSWETVFHLAHARDISRVMEVATTEYFRKQLVELRPMDSVLRDARYAVQAAGMKADVVRVVRATLFLAELAQRANMVEAWRVGDLLFKMGALPLVMEYFWDGPELRVSERTALKAAQGLYRDGEQLEARRLFEAAEPLSLFQSPAEGDQTGPGGDLGKKLKEWAEVVPLFRPAGEVIGIISRFVPPKSRFHPEEDPAPGPWRRNLLFHAALAARRAGKNNEADAFERTLMALEGENPDHVNGLTVHKLRDLEAEGKLPEARELLRGLLHSRDSATYDHNLLLVLAQGAVRLLGDNARAEELLAKVPIPSLMFDASITHEFHDHVGFLRFYRLLAYFGKCPGATEVAPDPKMDEDWPRVLFARTLVQIARLWADAWRGIFHKGLEIRQYFYQPLRLYQRGWREIRSWHSWHVVQSFRKDINELLVEAVREHGRDAVVTLKEEIESIWSKEGTWPSDARRDIAIALYKAGIPREWAEAQLDSIGTTMLEGHDVSGRIDQCEAQATAWITLGQVDKAAAELKRLTEVSFGVGYRKDFQMDSWVKWLSIVIERDPALAPERISLFAASIVGTEETTEGRGTRSATLALIQASSPVSPRRTVRLMGFFERHGCISHTEAVDALLRVALGRRQCRPSVIEAVFTNYLAAFSADSHAELAEEVLRALGRERNKSELTDICFKMARAVRLHMVPSTRPLTLKHIKDVAVEFGLPLDVCDLTDIPQPKEDENHYLPTLRLKDGTELNKGEIENRASTLAGFLALYAERADGPFRWEGVVERLLPKLDLLQARELTATIENELNEPIALAKLSIRLSELSDPKLAWKLGQKALTGSQPYGWIKWGDGGTRLWAMKALVAANPAGRSLVLSRFAEDISSGVSYPNEVVQNLSEIVPLFPETASVMDVYLAVEEYVKAIAQPLSSLEEARAELTAPATDDTFEQAVCDIMAWHLGEFVPILTQAAASTLCRLLELGSASAVRSIKRLLTGSPREQTEAIALFEVLAVTRRDLLKPFAEELRSLTSSPNYWASVTARRLCAPCGLEVGDRPPKPLPAIYTLSLPPTFQTSGPIAPDEPLPGSDNPRNLVRPYDRQLSALANLASLDEESVITRAAFLMRDETRAEDLLPETEERYRYRLHRAGLELPYRRLRGAYAREAMQRVAGELVDAGRIDNKYLPEVERLIRFTDPVLAAMSPSRRPVEVVPLAEIEPFDGRRDEWVKAPPQDTPAHTRIVGGRTVIGEFTELRLLGHGSEREKRVSTITEQGVKPRDTRSAFGHVHEVLMSEFPNIWVSDRAEPLLVLQNYAVGMDVEGCEWLTLNPMAAETLGWVASSNGLLRWVDGIGAVMVETLWWKDGRVGQYGHRGTGEVSTGWLVLASELGFKGILSLFKMPVRAFILERSHGDGKDAVSGSVVIREEPLHS